ncbi:E3 ubiquitin-protein ligase TRIM56-like [Glandiceps talaboti]
MAAVDALDRIDEDFLTCPICHDRISNPKILDCLHSYCGECLVDYEKKNKGFRKAPSCPVCRSTFQLPEDGVIGLKGNFFLSGICEVLDAHDRAKDKADKIKCFSCEKDDINSSASYCLQCGDFMCLECANHHKRMKTTKEHEVLTGKELHEKKDWTNARSKTGTACKKHPDEILKLYCKQCELPVCVLCSLQDHTSSSKGHEVINIGEAAARCREDIGVLLTVAEEKVSEIQFELDEADRIGKFLDGNKKKAEDEIDQKAVQLIERLTLQVNQHAASLKEEVNNRYTRKHEDVTVYNKRMNNELKGASDACDYSRKVVRYGNSAEVLAMKKQVFAKLMKVDNLDVNKIGCTGSLKLGAADREPVVVVTDIGRVVWKLGGPALTAKLNIGDRVERGNDWTWGNQDGGINNKGTVMSTVQDGLMVKVKWDNGYENLYRVGCGGSFDLEMADETSPERKEECDRNESENPGWLSWMFSGWQGQSQNE